MAAWDSQSAITTLRRQLGDGAADKYDFKVDVVPTPDGTQTRFFAGRLRIVPDTLKVYVGGSEMTPSNVDGESGTFSITPAPDLPTQCSFFYQWFTDDELISFLNEAAQLLRYTGYDDPEVPTGVRPILAEFACYYAYRRKAGEWAESVVAAAPGGYQTDQSRPAPNWRQLAEGAWKNATEQLKLYAENPLNGKTAPKLRFVAYRLPTYIPLS